MRFRVPAWAAIAVLGMFLLSAREAASSDGVFDLTWDSCTGPVDRVPTTDDQNSLYATVRGIDQPHKAYRVQLVYGDAATRAVPDAWRFDLGGCQSGWLSVFIDHLAPAAVAKTCPSFQGPRESILIKDVRRISEFKNQPPWDPNLMCVTLASAYGYMQEPVVPDPALRYFLARILFDHTFSVEGETTPGADCGGFETAICFATMVASYLTPEGDEILFGLTGNRGVTIRGTPGCPYVSAAPTTWGSIKGQYRR